eukprot:TRINITY_DN73668_c0_g1_i1.p1 TRINITY_DN73668_c0_g1~~TRINITY_DN73668_c0_g1_i1.p1  ORF type:complete len:185 (-),score=49.81 TRINITY_DN73668_c0_g1_i1:53-607(-)
MASWPAAVLPLRQCLRTSALSGSALQRLLPAVRPVPLRARGAATAAAVAEDPSDAESRSSPRSADPRRRPLAERGYVARDAPRDRRYWPPVDEDEAPIELPGGRKRVEVCALKRDVDGYTEAQVVFSTRGGHKLFALNEEEFAELEKLAPRITEYLSLWEEKAAEEGSAPKAGIDEELRRQLSE